MCQRLKQDVLSFRSRLQPGNTGKTQFAVHIDRRPGRRGIVCNVERITNDLRILNFTSEMGLGNPLICKRNEITTKSCRQYFSISGGEFIAKPPSLTVVLPNRYEGPFLGNEHFRNVDWGQRTPIRSYDKSRSNRR